MSKVSHRVACLALLGLVLAAPMARAQSTAEAGRQILSDRKSAVVTVKIVLQMQYSGFGGSSQEQEAKTESTGTIIDPSGLTVLSLSKIDPASLVRATGADTQNDFQFNTKPTDIKILLEDGAEIAAKVVLRDEDLDLAFVRPIEPPASPLPYIDLADSAAPQVLDELIVINRLGRIASRVHSAAIETVEAVVAKPRTFYFPATAPTNSGVGCPAFTLDGKCVGILLMRAMSGGGMDMMGFGQSDNVAAVILPAADVLEASTHADEAAEAAEAAEPAPEAAAEKVEAPAEGGAAVLAPENEGATSGTGQ